MKVSLFMLSAYEEYDSRNVHMCRGHWNFQWKGRYRPNPTKPFPIKPLKVRRESFGGLLQDYDGKIYRLDDEVYEAIMKMDRCLLLDEILNKLDIKLTEEIVIKAA